jgi:hypothetical protein
MNELAEQLWYKARIGYNEQKVDPEVLEKFTNLVVNSVIEIIRKEEDWVSGVHEVREYFNTKDED